ncbi:MAG: hypothetical protein AB7E95_03710, partial [Kiritimatiellales bacterium]
EENMKAVNVAAVNAAKEQWAIINNKATGESVAWSDILPYIGGSITNQDELNIGGEHIEPNKIGTKAEYVP